MSRTHRSGRLAAPALTLALLGASLAVTGPASGATPAPPPVTGPSAGLAPRSGWSARGEDYPQVAHRTDLAIPMSDGTVLRGDLTLPARSDGAAAPGRFPVVVTITAYNKTVLGSSAGSSLAGPSADYLVKRGYAQLTVDARGTGSSAGQWAAFSDRENRDAGEIVEWAHSDQRPWSDGDVAMTGPSYMGISQIFAAAHHPAGLKAIFPQVPAGDVYRDVVASGGQIDVGFIPLWLGLVTSTGLVPPAYGLSEPQSGLGTLLDHLIGAATFTLPLLLTAELGGEPAYDGPFYRERSPIEVIDQVDVPTFLVSGEYDLFQRGTPLLYENLRSRGVPTKMIIGPWDHLQASSGADLGEAGYGGLGELQLRWFDHYVKGLPDPALDGDIAPLTYYNQGPGTWETTDDWVGADRRARSYRLSGSSTTGVAAGSLTTGPVQDGTSAVLPVPVSGLCTRSTNQWTAGVPNAVLADLPCFSDNALNDSTGAVFETDPVTDPVAIQGPINARLYTSSPSGDGMVSVSVSDVAPDGTVSRLTGGWQVISHRALDRSRSRYLDGKVIQPYHPFTKAAQHRLGAGEVAPIDVEVFPTAAEIRPGHRLRLAVQAFDVPHLLPSLPDLGGVLTVLTLHASAEYPSELTVPVVADEEAPDAGTPGAPETGGPGTARAGADVRAHLRPKRSARHRAGAVTVRVRDAARAPVAGRVTVRLDGHRIATRTLGRGGRTSVRLPGRGRTGRHRVVVRYRGSDAAAPARVVRHWRVR